MTSQATEAQDSAAGDGIRMTPKLEGTASLGSEPRGSNEQNGVLVTCEPTQRRKDGTMGGPFQYTAIWESEHRKTEPAGRTSGAPFTEK